LIGLRETLQETIEIFPLKNWGFPVDFPNKTNPLIALGNHKPCAYSGAMAEVAIDGADSVDKSLNLVCHSHVTWRDVTRGMFFAGPSWIDAGRLDQHNH
jgi:hypothetical protein